MGLSRRTSPSRRVRPMWSRYSPIGTEYFRVVYQQLAQLGHRERRGVCEPLGHTAPQVAFDVGVQEEFRRNLDCVLFFAKQDEQFGNNARAGAGQAFKSATSGGLKDQPTNRLGQIVLEFSLGLAELGLIGEGHVRPSPINLPTVFKRSSTPATRVLFSRSGRAASSGTERDCRLPRVRLVQPQQAQDPVLEGCHRLVEHTDGSPRPDRKIDQGARGRQ